VPRDGLVLTCRAAALIQREAPVCLFVCAASPSTCLFLFGAAALVYFLILFFLFCNFLFLNRLSFIFAFASVRVGAGPHKDTPPFISKLPSSLLSFLPHPSDSVQSFSQRTRTNSLPSPHEGATELCSPSARSGRPSTGLRVVLSCLLRITFISKRHAFEF